MYLPRIMISATGSGSGKTLITCGILQALVNRGYKTTSFKCGPDYIDPMFHSKVIGVPSRNLDSFFCKENVVRYLFGRSAKEFDISVMEGVMGYYDGIAGTSTKASSYDLASITKTPVLLVVNARGMSVSMMAIIKGFLEFHEESHIKGIILNQISKPFYLEMKALIEETLKIPVIGYVPSLKNINLESRHLGLVTPEKVENLKEKLEELSAILEESLDFEKLIEIAKSVEDISYQEPVISTIKGNPIVAVAKDEAFCFYYADNLALLQEMGATLVEFSPLYDKQLPENIGGLLLGGGYPELVARQLSENKEMIQSIRKKRKQGLPCMAECGGFMYLHEVLKDMEGIPYEMVGEIKGEVYKTNRLNRFGYITLTAKENQMVAKAGDKILGHEFHYFESSNCGSSFEAKKPVRETKWDGIHGRETLTAGFPHFYYYSNPEIAYRFLLTCTKYAERHGGYNENRTGKCITNGH